MDLFFVREIVINQIHIKNTVDRRNPAPVDRWLIPLSIGFQPSKVMQDSFHPQYHTNMQHIAMTIMGGGEVSFPFNIDG